MKTGRSINDLALEVNRQEKVKRDYVLPFPKLELLTRDSDNKPYSALHAGIDLYGNTPFEGPLTQYAHRQLGTLTGIPAQYYDKMQAFPELLKSNLQFWINQQQDDAKLIRTLDGNVRAVLSDSYRILDNFELFNIIVPYLLDRGAIIESCEVTERRLYIKAVTHKIQGEIKVGEPVSVGVIVTNSEIGAGALTIKPFLYFWVCTNGAVVDKLANRKYHTGRRNDVIEGFQFSKETRQLEDRLFWNKTREVIHQTLTEATLSRALRLIEDSTKQELKEPLKTIELVTKEHGIQQEEKESIIEYLMKGGDITTWGLGNAITRTAQDLESYDRATEFETIGFKVLSSKLN